MHSVNSEHDSASLYFTDCFMFILTVVNPLSSMLAFKPPEETAIKKAAALPQSHPTRMYL